MGGYVAVAAGGAIGASVRYGISLLAGRSEVGAFPWHTFGVNVLGAFLLGLLMAVLPASDAGERWRLFLGVGVLGGFTTFSTFSFETLSAAQAGHCPIAIGYAFGSVAAALLGVALGNALGRALV